MPYIIRIQIRASYLLKGQSVTLLVLDRSIRDLKTFFQACLKVCRVSPYPRNFPSVGFNIVLNSIYPFAFHAFIFLFQASETCLCSLLVQHFFSPSLPHHSHFFLANLRFSRFFQVSSVFCSQGRHSLISVQELACSLWVGAMLIFSVSFHLDFYFFLIRTTFLSCI